MSVSNNATGDTFVLDFINGAFTESLLSASTNGGGFSFIAGMITVNYQGITDFVVSPRSSGGYRSDDHAHRFD